MDIPTFVLGDFQLDFNNIISGGEANIFIGGHSSHEVAVKQWHGKYRDKNKETILKRETEILMENPDQHIINVIGFLIDEKSECIGYVMPYMAIGSLEDVIHNKGKNHDDIYTDEQKTTWITKTCLGLSHLHSKNIIHRDIKPSNILLGEAYDDVKLADFGIARSVTNITHSLTTGMGTNPYMAPEMLNGEEYTFSAEIYSLAITTWEILHRRIPYYHIANTYDLLYQISEGERPKLNDDLSEENKFIFICWDDDDTERPKINEILEFCENTTFLLSTSPVEKLIEKSPGGQDGKNNDSLVMLENNGQNWKQLNIKLPCTISYHGAQFLNNNIYIFGGYDSNSTYKLSESLQWEKMADMNEEHQEISNSSVILNNQIWVCGGWNRYNLLKSLEMYDPLTNEWKEMKDMNEERYSAAAAVVNGKIFCSGGSGWRDLLNSVECYDPSSDVWTLIYNMPQSVRGQGAVEMNGHFIVMGGCANGEYLNNVWALDTTNENAVWIEKPSMSIPRSLFSIAKIHDKIFVCGGGSKEDEAYKHLNLVEIFDGEVWRNGPSMPTSRYLAPAVVVPMQFARKLDRRKRRLDPSWEDF